MQTRLGHFFHRKMTQGFFLAIEEPLFDELIAADCVLPDPRRNVGPVGQHIQVTVANVLTQQLDRLGYTHPLFLDVIVADDLSLDFRGERWEKSLQGRAVRVPFGVPGL